MDWFLTGDNSKYDIWMLQVGGNDINESEGTSIPIYIFLSSDVKIKPQEANHTLSVTDAILLVSGGGDPFVNTDGAYTVRINYQQPVQAITISSGSGLSPEQAEIIEGLSVKAYDMWRLHGLDPSSPMTVTMTSRTAGDIDMDIVSVSGESVTVTRK